MIKGVGYDKQKYEDIDFAVMTYQYFNKSDGVILGCNISNTATNITISEGWFIASGFNTRIFSPEIITASAGKLVYEIDRTKENTNTIFNQGVFKIITGEPRKDNLFNGGTIYQVLFAEITMSGSQIAKVTDKRQFFNFDSIYSYIRNEIQKIEDGSLFLLKSGGVINGSLQIKGNLTNNEGNFYLNKDNFYLINGEMEIPENTQENLERKQYLIKYEAIDFPAGFNSENCVVISIGTKFFKDKKYIYGHTDPNQVSVSMITGNVPFNVTLGADNNLNKILLGGHNMSSSKKVLYYKIVLMKI